MPSLGSRGPNMSRFLTDLNGVASAEQDPQAEFDDEFFKAFANDFVDLDNLGDAFTGLAPAEFEALPASTNADGTVDFEPSQPPSDFLSGDFNFTDFPTYPPVVGGDSGMHGQSHPYPLAAQSQLTSPVSTAATQPSSGPRTGDKRKRADFADPKAATEEAARLAAEEDKRRRNTAASARFRIKKKQREQALEKTAKEMTEKASTLETKVQQLEMENKWLKSLITEKNGGKNDLKELYDKFTRDNSSNASDSKGKVDRTDGVGTSKKVKGEKA